MKLFSQTKHSHRIKICTGFHATKDSHRHKRVAFGLENCVIQLLPKQFRPCWQNILRHAYQTTKIIQFHIRHKTWACYHIYGRFFCARKIFTPISLVLLKTNFISTNLVLLLRKRQQESKRREIFINNVCNTVRRLIKFNS